MPEPLHGIAPEQYRTDMPAPGPSNTLPRASVGTPGFVVFVLFAIASSVCFGVWLIGLALRSPVTPLPSPASREAVLERQVGALATHVAELENRNRETLESLDSFERPTPTPTYIYIGPGESTPK